jgi:hypothetical protein
MVRSISRKRRWSLVYPALLSLGGGVLASCAINEAPPWLQTSAARPVPSPEAPAARSAAPRPARKPTPPPTAGNPGPASGEEAFAMTGTKATESAAGSETPSPSDLAATSTSPVPPSQIPLQPELIGLDQPAATRLLGPATEKSDEPPATVWRYKTATCELDLFFYLDLRSGRMRTLHYTLKDKGSDTTRRQDCLRSLIASRGH